jgi:hypothetical protein
VTDGIYIGKTRVVYTVILGDYDDLRPPENRWERADFDHVCFADRPENHLGKGWIIVPVPTPEGSLGRACREYFNAPHHFMPAVEFSILLPGNGKLTQSAHGIFELVRDPPSIATPNHPRGCIYKEAEACIQMRKDDKDVIQAQMERYRERGYPSKNGLNCCTFIVRRHTDEVRVFGDLWWAEVCEGSMRDQLSFNYVAWKTGTRVRTLNGHYRHAGKRYNTAGGHKTNGGQEQ